MKAHRGFTLVEVMIVVGIIVALAALAIPSLVRAKMSANESVAQASLKVISGAEVAYRVSHERYADLGELDDEVPAYIDSTLAGGKKNGYDFSCSGTVNTFVAIAVPVSANTGMNRLCVTEDGVVRTDQAINDATGHDACQGYSSVS